MFCRKCGASVPEDSQFCSKCGQSVSVVASSSGTAAAVAPALERSPVPKATQSRSSNRGTVIGVAVVLLLLVIWAVQHVQHTTAQPLPSPRLQTQSTGNVAFTVNAGGTYYYKFTVPAGALNVTLKGHFSATGGSGNDIQVIVVSEDEYVNLQNGHNAKSFYNSGQVTQGSPASTCRMRQPPTMLFSTTSFLSSLRRPFKQI